MNSRTSRRFRALLAALPADVRKQALKAYRLFEADPGHPGLNFELIDPKLGLWSARVNEGYRVLGTRQGADILWIWIGTHSEYEKLIGRR